MSDCIKRTMSQICRHYVSSTRLSAIKAQMIQNWRHSEFPAEGMWTHLKELINLKV